jgi:Ca2+-binding EF-hand superfamily protein
VKSRTDTLRLPGPAPEPGRAESVSEASARLDAELKAKIMRAMEKAFRHFDTDHSNTIDVEEFVEVLRALGQDLSTKEVKGILKKSSRNSEVLHFEDFERAVYPYLRERIAQSAKISENMLRTTFQVNPGILCVREKHWIFI